MIQFVVAIKYNILVYFLQNNNINFMVIFKNFDFYQLCLIQ